MVIAHNPGIHELALHLAGDGDDDSLRRLRTKFPTGALATMDLGDGEWGTRGNSASIERPAIARTRASMEVSASGLSATTAPPPARRSAGRKRA